MSGFPSGVATGSARRKASQSRRIAGRRARRRFSRLSSMPRPYYAPRLHCSAFVDEPRASLARMAPPPFSQREIGGCADAPIQSLFCGTRNFACSTVVKPLESNTLLALAISHTAILCPQLGLRFTPPRRWPGSHVCRPPPSDWGERRLEAAQGPLSGRRRALSPRGRDRAAGPAPSDCSLARRLPRRRCAGVHQSTRNSLGSLLENGPQRT